MTNAHIKFVLLMVGAVPMSLYGLYSLVHGSYLLAVVVLGAAVFWAAWSLRILRAGKTPPLSLNSELVQVNREHGLPDDWNPTHRPR
jgi:hypothetical protein